MAPLRRTDLLVSLVLGLSAGIAALLSWSDMPQYALWNSIDITLFSGGLSITLFSLCHLIIGLAIFIPAIYSTLEIVRVNQAAHAGKNNPLYLLTTGFYEKQRHPMTGMFMLIVTGFFFTLCLSLGLLFILAFIALFHLFTLYEENSMLFPRFGAEYESYMKEVPTRYFRKELQILVILLLFANFLGIFL
jgi:protein-S-isoprenylcysteine O-methyltransferase Ste14